MTFPSLFVLQCIGEKAVPLHPKTRNNKSKTNMKTICDVFKQQVTAQPDAVAVMDEKKCLTYGELDALATEIADGFPVKQPAKVGIVMNHSVEMIATILAALKSGAAYVPAEPSFPKERIKYIMEDCDFVVTDKGIQHIHNNINKVSDLAYILYTSGTTGKPKGVMIYNTYGPSETTVCASYFRVDNAQPLADGTFPIGKAVLGTNIEILDGHLQPVREGEKGEICIFGDGISLGYQGDVPENQNFTTMPDGRRVYRSGDLGYVLPDGNLAFLHRKDKQVMIMGKRVESDEVENVLCDQREVETAVVCPQTDTDGLSYLVAYVVPRSKRFSLNTLKRSLADHLTSFMIPEFFVTMPSLPMTPNGKVDRRALPIVRKEGRLYA